MSGIIGQESRNKKDILITGLTRIFTPELLQNLAKDYRVVLLDAHEPIEVLDADVRCLNVSTQEEAFEQIFDVYSFHTIIFASGYSDGQAGFYGELQDLEKLFEQSEENAVDKVVILSSIESLNYVAPLASAGNLMQGREYISPVALQSAQEEELIRYLSAHHNQKTVILRAPYLSTSTNEDNFLGKVYQQLFDNKKVVLPYPSDSEVDFIGEYDLANLFKRIIEENADSSQSYYVCSGFHHTFGEMAAILEEKEPWAEFKFTEGPDAINREAYPNDLRRAYGWIPTEDVLDHLQADYEAYCIRHRMKKRTIRDAVDDFLQSDNPLFQILELLVFFVLVELLNRYMGVSIYFRYVDLRLFFVVIMGTMHGVWIGVAAALLASIALLVQYMLGGVEWTLLFYNVENWIPFMIYIATGAITGYVKNRRTEEITFSQEEYDLLHKKYIFLQDVYRGAMENKGAYKKQILGFKDSFGRIFDAVQRLDSVLPQSIFMEALLTMEDILENRSIAIYSVDDYQRFARLVVCSNRMGQTLNKSMSLAERSEMFNTIKAGGIYRNLEMEEGMPAYGCGIFREDKLVLFVVCYYASPEQYNMNYMNIFRILCGLVQTSFLRALENEELTEQRYYYPGTNIMRPQRFAEILAVQQEMKDAQIADFVLVQIDERDRQRVSDEFSRRIRAADIIGEGEDGAMYLLLAQVNRDSFKFVERRLLETGIAFHVTERVG